MADQLQPMPSSNAGSRKGIGGWGGSVLMTNNINPFLVSPWSPDQASKSLQGPNLLADTITAYTTGGTIQIESTMNIVPPNTITYDGKAILPYQINNTNSLATTLNDGTEGYFEVAVSTNNPGATANLIVYPTYATIGNNIGPNYQVTIDGYLTTSNAVTINSISQPALQVNGNVNISGSVSLSNVQVTKLGVGTAVDPGYVFDVSGSSLFKGSAGITGFLGVGKQTPTLPLDVVGSAAISNNITIGSNTITQAIGVGKPTITPGLAADISGNTNISGTLGVANNVSITATEMSVLRHIACVDVSGSTIQVSENLIAGNKIGINTSNPSYNLDVNGSAIFNGGGGVRLDNGSSLRVTTGNIQLDSGNLTVSAGDIYTTIGAVYSSNIYTSNVYTSNMYAINTYLSNIYTSNIYSSNIYTNNIYSFNIDASNMYVKNIYSSNIDASNMYVKNIYSSNIDASNMYVKNIYSSNIDASNMYVKNIYSSNIYSSNIYTKNIYSSNIDASNMYVKNIYSSNIYSSNIYTNNIYSSNIDASNIYVKNIYSSNIDASNIYTTIIHSPTIDASNIYVKNIYSSNIDASNIYTTIIHSPTIDASNIYAINTYSSNIDASNIYANNIYSSNVDASNIYAINILSRYIDVSSIDVSNLSVSSILEVSGNSIFTGGISINSNVVPQPYTYNSSNNINIYNSALQIQPINNAYLIAPASIQVIKYNPNSTGPGWIQSASGDVSLNLVFNPTIYIIDGSGLDASMNIQIVPLIGELDTPVPGSNCPYPGIAYTFVARNAPPEGHQITYPYSMTGIDWWNNLTCNIIIQEPFNKVLVCVGTNDYSST